MEDYELLHLWASGYMHAVVAWHWVKPPGQAVRIECDIGRDLWRWAGVAMYPD